jgi:hypothetical protein
MVLQPTQIQTNDQMDILAGQWTITCDFQLSQPHTLVFRYVAPSISFFYSMQLTVDDAVIYSQRLFFPAIRSDECTFMVEGVPCIFSYQFGIFSRKINVIVGHETVLDTGRGL